MNRTRHTDGSRAAGWMPALFILSMCVSCDRPDRAENKTIRLGYQDGPHASAIYRAEFSARTNGSASAFVAVPFNTSGDIGYALINGDIDAGFIETTKATALLGSVTGLRAVGAITFPYGATLLLRKDLDIRLEGLSGRTVAVQGRRCRLLHQFLADTERLGVNPDTINLVPIPFDQMIPALEARKVDAILTRGGHALLAVAERHKVLYQNWDVTGDDPCCPKTLAQVEQILITRAKGVGARRITALVTALEAASAASSDVLRSSVAARTPIPLDVLAPFPVASFTVLTDEQQAELGSSSVLEDEEGHEHDCATEGCTHEHE